LFAVQGTGVAVIARCNTTFQVSGIFHAATGVKRKNQDKKDEIDASHGTELRKDLVYPYYRRKVGGL
jgi:hypothetical protein